MYEEQVLEVLELAKSKISPSKAIVRSLECLTAVVAVQGHRDSSL